MSFLGEFDDLAPEQGNEKLFEWMCERPDELCAELAAANRPVLRFRSRHPANPDTGWKPPRESGSAGDSTSEDAYLLTDPRDVRHALEWFQMKPYAREPNRYFLGIDEETRHEALRGVVEKAFGAIDATQTDDWMTEAIEEAWDRQLLVRNDARSSPAQSHDHLSLDVWGFTRDAVLRFVSRYYGLPQEQVVSPEFSDATLQAFRRFVWKIHARHFVPNPACVPEMEGADQQRRVEPLEHITGVISNALGHSLPGTFIHELKNQRDEANVHGVVMNQGALVANVIGAVQGFVDNAVGGTCRSLHVLIQDEGAYTKLQAARQSDDVDSAIKLLRNAQRNALPAPWLPRVGPLDQLPSRPEKASSAVASCVLCIQSATGARTEPNMARRRDNIASLSPDRYEDPDDLRLGFGYHRCIGRSLGDRFIARVLLRIASLDAPRAPSEPEREWGWIVHAYQVQERAAATTRTADWDRLQSSNVPVAFCTRAGAVSTRAGIRSMSPDAIGSLPPEALQVMTDMQLESLTERQTARLNARQLSALGLRIAAFSPTQLATLSTSAVQALDVKQIDILSESALRTTLRRHAAKLAPVVLQRAQLQAGRHAVLRVVQGVKPRPYALSLWSTAYDTCTTESYASWPGLVDPAWTARRLPPCDHDYSELLQKIGSVNGADQPGVVEPRSVVELFQRRREIPAKRTSLLFAWFAQWVSDSFLRTNPQDRRRNDSNHEVDLCQLYGLNESTTRALRSFDGGQMLSQDENGEEYLPLLFDDTSSVQSRFETLSYVNNGRLRSVLATLDAGKIAERQLFASAMERGNSSFGYTAMTTLFLREHNRVARGMQQRQPGWSDERLFQTTRHVMIVLLLKIVIEEYINHIAGAEGSQSRPYRLDHDFAEDQPWYRQNRIALEFNLLYRWHSLVPSHYQLPDKRVPFAKVRLDNRPLRKYGLGALLDAASSQPAARPGLHNTGHELLPAEQAALKMARDYRVAPYQAYRKEFRLPPVLDFMDLTNDSEMATRLQTLYGEPSNVEFLVGLYAETPHGGRLFGDLMTRMLAYDAFTQTFTNPLLSRNLFEDEATFSRYGREQIEETHSLQDLWRRNCGDDKDAEFRVSFDLP